MDKRLDRKLGVFGPRNSGKTTYWACLYGSKGSTDGSVSFTHEPTREQLDALWRSLYDGVVAPATAQGEPQDIFFSLHSDATTWCVSTKDYSGSLVELSRHGQGDAEASHDLRRNIASWVRDCDAMLVLVPADLADQDEGARVGFRRAMEALLDAFHDSDHPGPLPVCLAVTKSDMLPMEPAITSTPSAADSPPVLPEWLDELTQLVRHQVGEDHARVFLTSAFGGHAREDATRPPETGPRPLGLEEPLRWVLAASNRCLSAPVIAKARRSLERRWFHGYGKAFKACDRVAAKGLPEKERQELDELKARLFERRQRQRRRRAIAGVLIAVLLTLTGLWLHADRLATKAKAAMSAESVAPEAIASVRTFVESTNPACFILYADERKRSQDWYDARAQEQVVRVKDMLSRNADVPELHWRERVERAEARTKACRGFAELFPQRKERLEFDQEVSRAQALMETLQAYGPFDDGVANVIRSLEPASVSQARDLVRGFTDSFPPDKYPLRTAAFQRLHSVVDSKAKGEEHARLVTWEAGIRADYEKDPSLRSRHLEEIEKWLAAYQSSGIQEMETRESGLRNLGRRISEDWDRNSYQTLETAAGRMFEDEDKLKEAIQYGEEYLQANREVKAMQEHVRNWLAYARELLKNQRIHMNVAALDVSNCGPLKAIAGDQYLKMTSRVRGDTKQEWRDWHDFWEGHLPDVSTPTGQGTHVTVPLTGYIRIDITRYSWRRSNVSRSGEVRLLRLLEQGQQVRSDRAEAHIDVNGAKVTVVISDLPERRNLPSYEKPQ